MADDEIPTAIKVMADYGCYPLWDVGPTGPDNVDPWSLPLSEGLCLDLDAWADRFDAILDQEDPAASAFRSPEEEQRFTADGFRLAQRVAVELGAGTTVSYFWHMSGDEVPVT